jgi:hypothetical protein
MMALAFSPFGRALGALLLSLALLWGVYNAGERSERSKCDAAVVRAELDAARADLDAAKRAAANAEALAQSLADQENTNRGLADEIATTADACRATGDDIIRLRRVK